MSDFEQFVLQAAEQEAARDAARKAEILAGLTPDEKEFFDLAVRGGAWSFGSAVMAVGNYRRRRDKEAAKLAARKPKPATRPDVLTAAAEAGRAAERRWAAATAPKPATRHSLLTYPKPTTAKSYPATALQLRAGTPFELLASSGLTAGPVTANVLARSGKAIRHPWWGLLVHDMAGREQLKDRLPLDYAHDVGEVLGYAENWRVDGNSLVCTAVLLPGESERAKEVVNLARAGVPYEASISFAPIEIEELNLGKSATINGQLISGPASVIRRWRLTGLAVCPRGADPNTETKIR